MHLDWDGRHGAVSGALNTTAATLTTGWAGHMAGLSPAWAVLAAGAGAAGTHVAGMRKRVTGATLGLRAAAWLGVGGWCSWAVAEGPWTRTAIEALAAGAIGLGTAMAGAHHIEEKKAEEKALSEAAAKVADLDGKRREIAEEWQQRIATVCTGVTVQIVAVEDFPSGAGFTLDGNCLHGSKWRDLKAFEDALAAEAQLPEGCGVEVKKGRHRGAVLIDVTTVNAFVEDCPYPTDYSPLSINDPVSQGVFRDGSKAEVLLRELSGLIAARRGAGKTNLMNVGIANGVRTVDNLDWVIDLNGGGLALAWLHAWHKAGRPGRPPIDWVADTPAKALAMAEAALRIAKARKPGYKKREIAANDDKLPVGPDVPAITIRCDEIAEIFSPRARKDEVLKKTGDILIQIVELARAVAINALLAALRVTQDVLAEPQILKQAGLKIGMQSDDAELAYLCGWGDGVSSDDIPYPGCGVMKIGEEAARPFKAYRIKPAQIADIVVATSGLRPELDELSRSAAGQAYEDRWVGMDHLFGLGDLPAPDVDEEDGGDGGETAEDFTAPRGSGVTANWGTEPPRVDTQAALDQADAARDRLRKEADEAVSRDVSLDKQFREVLEGGGAIWKAPDDVPTRTGQPMPTPGVTDDARWPVVFSLVAKAGPAGISPTALAEAYQAMNPGVAAPSRSAITEWLKAEPKIHQPARGLYALRPEET